MGLTRVSTLAGAFALALAAAGPAAAQLAGSEWLPATIGDVEISTRTDMFVRFGSRGRLSGHGGCNNFTGTYELSGDGIEIGPLAATKKACTERVMDHEDRLLRALAAATRFARARGGLSLTDAEGNLVARFRETDAD